MAYFHSYFFFTCENVMCISVWIRNKETKIHRSIQYLLNRTFRYRYGILFFRLHFLGSSLTSHVYNSLRRVKHLVGEVRQNDTKLPSLASILQRSDSPIYVTVPNTQTRYPEGRRYSHKERNPVLCTLH